MSYDLDFYKKENSNLTKQDIENYLTENLVQPNAENSQWFFESEDTGVYYSFESDDNSSEDENEVYDGFEHTEFWFNINFLRPNFFGLEAFNFVDKFVEDMDLYVLNPQSEKDADHPIKPSKNELYENWSKTNFKLSKEYLQNDEFEFYSYPLDKSNEIWTYNFNRQNLQEKLGEEVFVPKIFLLKRKSDNQIISVSTWSEYIPNVFPKVDHFLLNREFKKLFKTFQEAGFISCENLMNTFGSYMDDLDENKVIYYDNAEKVKDSFNKVKLIAVDEFAEGIEIEKVLTI